MCIRSIESEGSYTCVLGGSYRKYEGSYTCVLGV